MEDDTEAGKYPPTGVEAEPAQAPPAPSIPVRPSILHFVIGNLLLLTLLILYAFDMLPGRQVIFFAWVIGLVGTGTSVANESTLEHRYTTPRFTELRPFYHDDESALKQAREDFQAWSTKARTTVIAAFPGFLITLVFLYYFFIDANEYLGEWILPLRIAGAFMLAVFGWFGVFLIWGFATFTPRPIHDYLALRREEEQASRLPAEDRNDIHIITQITNLESLHRRVDTYTLESALLSALSFSSFLSIVLAERDYLDDLEGLFMDPLSWEPLPTVLGISGVTYPYPPTGYINDNMVGMISLALLLCAATFLGVLVARLRFNDGYRDADCLLRTAERLNDKEDKAIEANQVERLEIYSNAIENMLYRSQELQTALTITLLTMRISRNAGILFFSVALILCGLFFNDTIAVLITILFVGAFLLGYADRIVRNLLRKRVFNTGFIRILFQFKRRNRGSPVP